jgi:hypothetical protein
VRSIERWGFQPSEAASGEMRRISVLAAAGALGLCFLGGFFLGAWLWTSTRDTRGIVPFRLQKKSAQSCSLRAMN